MFMHLGTHTHTLSHTNDRANSLLFHNILFFLSILNVNLHWQPEISEKKSCRYVSTHLCLQQYITKTKVLNPQGLTEASSQECLASRKDEKNKKHLAPPFLLVEKCTT